MIFDLLKNKKFEELYKYIKENENEDLDVYDENFNYFIQYLVMYNNYDIIEYILKHRTIRLDILDTDGRNLLYNTIKFNYIDLLKLFIENDKNNIGISIYDVRDKNGHTGIHYAIMFNNINAFNILYGLSNINDINIYDFCIEYNSNLFIHILDSEIKRNHDIKHFINNKGESVLQIALNYEINNIINYIINNKPFLKQIINNASHEFGLTALHQAIIINNSPIKLIKEGENININKSDYMGNTALHYSIIEKRYDVLKELYNHDNKYFVLNYNETNLNGNTALHLLIEDINVNNLEDNKSILLKLIENTDLNIMNNDINTVLRNIFIQNLWKDEDIKKILVNKPLNIFIPNKDNETIYDLCKTKEEFINIVVESYMNVLKKNQDKLVIDWEINCGKEDKLLKTMKKLDCKSYISKLIKDNIKSVPTYNEIKLKIDSGIYMENCYYIGSNIDILFGLLYLHTNTMINNKTYLLLEYPLTNNKGQSEIENYYTQMGINYSFKMDFCNIEILWSYMKLIYIKNFDSLIKTKLNNNGFLIVPLGIDTATGSHANILIIDNNNKTIERFEPNGKNSPRGFYYNQDLLDNLLKNKFNQLLPEYKYYSPTEYLPTIGFQLLETVEDKCKKIGDPNGFCAVWCIWWAEQRITNPEIKSSILAEELIKEIKLSNISFKKIIRNFSIKIVQLRDKYLENVNLDIDKWMNGDYDDKQLEKLENNIIQNL